MNAPDNKCSTMYVFKFFLIVFALLWISGLFFIFIFVAVLERRDSGFDLLSNKSLTSRNLQLLTPEEGDLLSVGLKLESRVSVTVQFLSALCEQTGF